ncbi:hypothetical protein PIB30_057120 [Stylosanthes scabra]|uniref:Uncharacterized protein n=1 Tax=Stylosanthes scabra TaxID=79078 RepID=A0ABU6RJH2_9FABA|nr:hypothetical protein [Stylosanthes scabra]
MALACPRGELNDIRPKQHKCVARSRPSLAARARPCVRMMAVARPRPRAWSSSTNYCKVRAPAPFLPRVRMSPLRRALGPSFDYAPAPLPLRARAMVRASLNRTPSLFLMDQKRKSEDAKRKGKLAMPPTQKSPRLAGLLPFAPSASPRTVLRSNKLLVLAVAATRGEPNPKAQASAQATVEKPSVDVKGCLFLF